MPNELSALVRLAGVSVDNLIVTPAESLHDAIAGRVFGIGGPIARPARAVHNRIARTAYEAVRTSAGRTARLTSSIARLATGDDAQVLSRTRRGRAVVSALNALAGDLLDEQRSDLAIPMSVSIAGVDVPCERDALRRAFPGARGRVAVFLHGLGETPESWKRGRHSPFGSRMRRDLAITPVYVRYNSGLRIADNGRLLSGLLELLASKWPVRVSELDLIGHSMGGLVARAACDAGVADGLRWTSRVRHLIALGAPHTGVPLEKFVHALAGRLRAVPESRPLADVLDLRSAGIRDLRHGYTSGAGDAEGSVGMLRRIDGCTYTFITASVSRSPRHPLSWLAGDLLVRSSSAAGRSSDGGVAVACDNLYHLAPLTHFDLLDHPEVYRRIRGVLAV